MIWIHAILGLQVILFTAVSSVPSLLAGQRRCTTMVTSFSCSRCSPYALLAFRVLISEDKDESIPNISSTEMESLYDLFYATNGDAWHWHDNSGQHWNFSSFLNNPCADNWQGIQCTIGDGGNDSHVRALSLPGYDMLGSLPSSIGNLTWLQSLDLSGNVLTSSLPESLCDITQLVNVSLNDNFLRGTVPQLIGVSLLDVAVLRLQSNKLSGGIPFFGANLVRLVELNLGENYLNSTIPSSLGELISLTALYLGDNQLTGAVPVTLFTSSRLHILNLQNNQLIGPLPNITTPSNSPLEFLNLRDNRISGNLPESWGSFTRLRSLNINNNNIHGQIPSSLGNTGMLFYLDLGHNELTGSIPDAMCDLGLLQNLNLEFNALTGAIPDCIGQIAKLSILNLGNNYLTGSLPEDVGQLTQLSFAYFDCNLLRGQLPNTLAPLQSLVILNVSNNCFSGTIPSALSRLSRLQVLLLENNALRGSLTGVFNASVQGNLTAVQVSNNQLTGSLPEEAFRIPSLTVFAAVSNCFDGSIPLSICNRTGLITLALDGLQSATSCQNKLLPGVILRTSSYTVAHPIKGGVPACLFALPHLATLHLSGNGLTGELPGGVEISPSLEDLSLSHNNLKGVIPDNIQMRAWSTLDLSYNRLKGTLSPKFSSDYTRNTSLYLEQNRLSGKIPASIVDISEISILGSNLFACSADRSDLPHNNDDKDKYQCGSDAMNSSSYTWLFIVTCLGVLGVIVWWFRTSLDRCMNITTNMRLITSWWVVVPPSSEGAPELWAKLKNMRDSFDIYKIICITSAGCTVYVIVLLLPLYAASKDYYGTFTHQYAWTASVTFMSGHVPFSVTLIMYVVLLVLVLTSVHALLHRRDNEAAAWEVQDSPRKSITENITRPSLLSYVVVYTCFATFNFAITAGANVMYVYVALNQSDNLLSLAQILLSLFKFALNSLCSPYLIHLLSRLALRYCEQHSKHAADAHFATADFIPVQLFVALFNTIAIPCIVVAIISSNCFYNAFRQAPAVSSTFTYHGGCLQDTSEEIASTATLGCAGYETLEATTSYSPPFKYTYQCSSSFITYYAPTYANLCIIASFVAPLAQVLLQRLHSRARRGRPWFNLLDTVLPRSLKPLPTPSSTATHDAPDTGYILDMQRLVDPHAYPPFFNATQQLISILTYFGMLLTFGVVFPPLAVTFLVTITCVTAFARLKVGRLLHNAINADMQGVLGVVDRECRGAGASRILRRSLRMVLIFSWCFYTLFLFDTLGDATGFQGAYWVLIVMPVMPLCALLVYAAYLMVVVPAVHGTPTSAIGIDETSNTHIDYIEEDLNTNESVTFNVLSDDV